MLILRGFSKALNVRSEEIDFCFHRRQLSPSVSPLPGTRCHRSPNRAHFWMWHSRRRELPLPSLFHRTFVPLDLNGGPQAADCVFSSSNEPSVFSPLCAFNYGAWMRTFNVDNTLELGSWHFVGTVCSRLMRKILIFYVRRDDYFQTVLSGQSVTWMNKRQNYKVIVLFYGTKPQVLCVARCSQDIQLIFWISLFLYWHKAILINVLTLDYTFLIKKIVNLFPWNMTIHNHTNCS